MTGLSTYWVVDRKADTAVLFSFAHEPLVEVPVEVWEAIQIEEMESGFE